MRKSIGGALLVTLLTCVGWAQEPVLRVIDLKGSNGPAHLQHRRPTDPQFYEAFVGSKGAILDKFKTDASTVASLEFLIGGRVGISKDTEIEVVNERNVAHSRDNFKKIILRNGALWVKADAAKLKQPIEIQTNGGTLGIKGTEFTIESQGNSSTLSLFEGQVEVKDDQNHLLQLAKPGDQVQMQLNQPPQVQHMDPAALRELVENGPLGLAMQVLKDEVLLIRQKHTEIERKLQGLFEVVNSDKPRLNSPFKEAYWQDPISRSSSGMTPNSALSTLDLFQWPSYPQADGYVVFLSARSDFKDLLFSARVRDTQAVYPSTARPLTAGQYYWRVVPVDQDDKPLQGASQATFQVATKT